MEQCAGTMADEREEEVRGHCRYAEGLLEGTGAYGGNCVVGRVERGLLRVWRLGGDDVAWHGSVQEWISCGPVEYEDICVDCGDRAWAGVERDWFWSL